MKASPGKLTDEREEELWQLLSRDRDDDARLELIDHYLSLAHSLAARLYLFRPDDIVEFEDYNQFAVVGLVESVDRFVPGGKSKFATYATYRIRGAILNGVEKGSETREQIAYKRRIRKDRIDSLAESGAGEEAPDLFEQMVELATGLAIGYMLEDSGLRHGKDISDEQDIPSMYGTEQLNTRLYEALDELAARDRMIINYHYFHQISFEEISRIFDVSKGRVSQIHKRVIQTIKKNLISKHEIDGYY